MNPLRPFIMPVLLLGCLLLPAHAFCQKAVEDVLYLRNGWILRGKITSAATDSLVKIQTRDHNLFVFGRTDISKMLQEPALNSSNRNFEYQPKGFSHYTELGTIAAKNSASGSAFTFQMVNGYKFNPWVFMGLGIGMDTYNNQSLLPLFASFRSDLVHQGGVLPFYFVDGGYAFNLSGEGSLNGWNTRYLGGLLFATGLGTKILVSHHTGFLVSVGYRYQHSAFEQEFVGAGGNKSKTELNYRRAVLRVGFTF
jgi:hypothetical protein